jgi:hypothetical protein
LQIESGAEVGFALAIQTTSESITLSRTSESIALSLPRESLSQSFPCRDCQVVHLFQNARRHTTALACIQQRKGICNSLHAPLLHSLNRREQRYKRVEDLVMATVHSDVHKASSRPSPGYQVFAPYYHRQYLPMVWKVFAPYYHRLSIYAKVDAATITQADWSEDLCQSHPDGAHPLYSTHSPASDGYRKVLARNCSNLGKCPCPQTQHDTPGAYTRLRHELSRRRVSEMTGSSRCLRAAWKCPKIWDFCRQGRTICGRFRRRSRNLP